jgi:uncharacterized damage-inducible protein DinB
METGNLFLQSAIKRFNDYKILAEKTFDQLNDAQMHFQPNETSNSIAIIMQHLHGNIKSRWTNFLTEDGEKPWRTRDEEFETKSLSKQQLLELWTEAWDVLSGSLNLLSPDDLSKTITIRKEPHTVIDAINRQITHYSYHVGQIVFLGKWIKDNEWKTLSIPKKGSAAFNEKMMGRKL